MDTNSSLVIAKEIVSGERLVWSGRPKQGVLLRGSDAFLIPFEMIENARSVYELIMTTQREA